jgi:hypothetical protein
MSKKQERILVESLGDIPRFASEDEEREWWATHDLADELWEPPTAEDLALVDELRHPPRMRARPMRKLKSTPSRQIASVITLDPEQVKAVQKIARQKKVDSEALIKQWIAEGIARERTGKARRVG